MPINDSSIAASKSTIYKPLVIAHRGASGYLPEHTLEAATLAYAQGADYIEQDLVVSKDLQLIVLHDIHLETVTDVALKFPNRQRKDGRFYVLDFTLAELKTLKVHERKNAKGSPVFAKRYQGNAEFSIATFDEQIELIGQLNRQFNKNIGLYPEIKSPSWHRKQGVDISQLVLDKLRAHQLDDASKAVYVQCFDFNETKRLRQQLGAKVKLIQLIADNSWNESSNDYTYLTTPEGLKEIAKVAQGIGPWIPQLVDLPTQQSTGLSKLAHELGLSIHPYTFRKDSLPKNVSSSEALNMLFKIEKVDGIFTDFTDTVVTHLAN
ncbi:glycerophosphodiester phosphodiesterase [Paraglaciecola aestuariivivens]